MTPIQAGGLVLAFTLVLCALEWVLRWVGNLGEFLAEIQRGEPLEGRGGPAVLGRDVRIQAPVDGSGFAERPGDGWGGVPVTEPDAAEKVLDCLRPHVDFGAIVLEEGERTPLRRPARITTLADPRVGFRSMVGDAFTRDESEARARPGDDGGRGPSEEI